MVCLVVFWMQGNSTKEFPAQKIALGNFQASKMKISDSAQNQQILTCSEKSEAALQLSVT